MFKQGQSGGYKKVRFTEAMIPKMVKDHKNGIDVKVLHWQPYTYKSATYQYHKKYSGMESSQLNRLKELKYENSSLSFTFTFIFFSSTRKEKITIKTRDRFVAKFYFLHIKANKNTDNTERH